MNKIINVTSDMQHFFTLVLNTGTQGDFYKEIKAFSDDDNCLRIERINL